VIRFALRDEVADCPPHSPCATPRRFDGAICIFGLSHDADEATILMEVSKFAPSSGATISRVIVGGRGTTIGGGLTFFGAGTAVVYFETHAHALVAKDAAQAAMPRFCTGLDMLYNERSYGGRDDGEGGLRGDKGQLATPPPSEGPHFAARHATTLEGPTLHACCARCIVRPLTCR
jgi:hypothetical protein